MTETIDKNKFSKVKTQIQKINVRVHDDNKPQLWKVRFLKTRDKYSRVWRRSYIISCNQQHSQTANEVERGRLKNVQHQQFVRSPVQPVMYHLTETFSLDINTIFIDSIYLIYCDSQGLIYCESPHPYGKYVWSLEIRTAVISTVCYLLSLIRYRFSPHVIYSLFVFALLQWSMIRHSIALYHFCPDWLAHVWVGTCSRI